MLTLAYTVCRGETKTKLVAKISNSREFVQNLRFGYLCKIRRSGHPGASRLPVRGALGDCCFEKGRIFCVTAGPPSLPKCCHALVALEPATLRRA